MSFFTAAHIAELRAVQESVMTDTCTISDGAHKVGQGQEWTPRGASVACGVSSLAQAIGCSIASKCSQDCAKS